MKIKPSKLFSIVILLSIIAMLVVQPVSARGNDAPFYASQPKTGQAGLTDAGEFEAFLDAYLANKMETHHIPGVVFTMVKDGQVFFSKGYGYADLEKQIPMDPENTTLTSASVSKVFTALGVLQLYDQGLINLNDDVHPFITEFELPNKYPGGPTFAHLLTHTDGFESRMIGVAALSEDDLRPLGEMLNTYMPTQLYPPGQFMTYGDFAANLAGHLIAEISGMTFEQYMDKNIFTPLEMANSTLNLHLSDEMRASLAQAYEFSNGNYEQVPYYSISYSPMGGLRTTAADMNRFMLALLNGGEYQGTRILSEAATQLMFTRQFAPHPKMGGITYGLFEHLENRRQLFFRDGDGVGVRSRVAFFPEENMGFYIAYNSGDSNLRLDIISAILNEYYAGGKESVPEGMPGYQDCTSQFAGTYRYSNADQTTFGKSMLFFSQLVDVSASKDGYLLVETTSLMGGEKSSPMGGFEGVSQWVEVEPLYFERVGGKGQIAFGLDENDKVAYMYSGQGYHAQFNKLPWYETQSFHMILIELVALLLISMVISTFVIWPLGALIRKLRKQSNDNPVSWGAVTARLWGALVGGMLVLFLFRVFGVLYAIGGIANMPNFVWGITPDMIESLNSIYLPVMLALVMPVFTILTWVKGWWKIPMRVYYTIVTLAVFAGIWWTHYWNLIGFRM